MIGSCGKLYNEVIFTIAWGMRWVGACGMYEGEEKYL